MSRASETGINRQLGAGREGARGAGFDGKSDPVATSRRRQWGYTRPREIGHREDGAFSPAWAWTEEVRADGRVYFDTHFAVPLRHNGTLFFEMPCLLEAVGDHLNFEFTEEIAAYYSRIDDPNKWREIRYFEGFLRSKVDDGFPHGFARYIYREENLSASAPEPWEL